MIKTLPRIIVAKVLFILCFAVISVCRRDFTGKFP